DRVIAISPAVSHYLEKTAKINPKKIKLINNGVEPPKPLDKNNIMWLREKLGIWEDELVIGSVGRIRNDVKRFSDIIEAVADLPDRSKIKILIVGEGPDTALLRSL